MNKIVEMRELVKEYTIFIDTCSLLSKGGGEFWCKVISILQEFKKKIIIPYRVYEELEKHSRNNENPYLVKDANQWLELIPKLQKGGLIEIRGESDDNFADNVFQVVFTKFRVTHKLLLITQDNNLAKDILGLNQNRSVKAKNVCVKRIGVDGFLEDFYWNNNGYLNYEKIDDGLIEESASTFNMYNDVTDIPDELLDVTHIPKENDIVFTSQGKIILREKVATGGEGVIYNTDTPYVAKIYKKGNNTRRRYEKIKLLLKKKLSCEGICAPVEPLYNINKEFVGYLMQSAKGIEIQKSIFVKPLFIKKFPKWKKRDTVELCITILNKIKYLHNKNIIIGDINPSNILVVSPKEVYFVDTDSYQIENFPCPVGTINFTAPEIQRKPYSSFLRSIGNENFAVATLLFMIMLPGKPPYSQQGGEDPIENIIKMDFSYPFEYNSNKKTPDGPWRYIWSHLTHQIKGAFYKTFRKGQKHSLENTRYSVDQWLGFFGRYLELLDSGQYGQQDAMSEELYPTRYKKNRKMKYIVCPICGQEVLEGSTRSGICKNCLNDGEKYKCARCGKEMIFTNYDRYINKVKKPDICDTCKYTTDSFSNNVNNKKTSNHYDEPVSNKFSNGNKDCFITTAICEYQGKDDNCKELTVLRNYRDEWLSKQKDGLLLIKEYYRIAPKIVEQLRKSKNYSIYCEILWNMYLLPCIDMITVGQLEKCKNKYIEMVKDLQNRLNNE